jgi:hypothetical protein
LGVYDAAYRDKKVVGVFVRFRAPDIAGDLAALGYYSFIADIYGGEYEDNAEAGQNLVTINELQGISKRISLALDQLIRAGS